MRPPYFFGSGGALYTLAILLDPLAILDVLLLADSPSHPTDDTDPQ